MRRAVVLCCAAALGLTAQTGGTAQTATSPAADGGIGIQLLEAPVQRRADPRAHRYIVDHVPPGTGIRRQVLVVNNSDRPRLVRVYAGAATIERGRFRFGGTGTSNELTSWTTIDQPRLALPPDGQTRVSVAIDVPATAAEGERYAVVWAAISSQDPVPDKTEGSHGGRAGDETGPRPSPDGNVHQIHRVGVRVYLDVGMGGEPRSDFVINELVPARDDAGVPSVAVSVRNTGGRAIDLEGELELSEGPAGSRAGPFEVVQGATLLPGETGSVLVELPADLPDGPWTATVRLRSGLVSRTTTGKLTFPEPGRTGVPASVLSGMLTTPTLVGGSLAVGLLVLGGLAITARRQRSTGRR
ncbi:hypothetical protein ACN27F_21360 [Solwaraspora sp. WMMB335]|uniref:hypothetical protein n=1 Tax=Solwaraspora sp. WMMB335 TaxID=3404118 RepID=UPI003B931857